MNEHTLLTQQLACDKNILKILLFQNELDIFKLLQP